jgi:hypothetical protein
VASSSILIPPQWLAPFFHLQNNNHASSNSTHTWSFFIVLSLHTWSFWFNDECQEGAQKTDSCFPIGPFHIFITRAKMRQWDNEMMRQWDDEITLITNPSCLGVRQHGRRQVDVIVSAVCKCGSDSWFWKFQNNIRPTCAVWNNPSNCDATNARIKCTEWKPEPWHRLSTLPASEGSCGMRYKTPYGNIPIACVTKIHSLFSMDGSATFASFSKLWALAVPYMHLCLHVTCFMEGLWLGSHVARFSLPFINHGIGGSSLLIAPKSYSISWSHLSTDTSIIAKSSEIKSSIICKHQLEYKTDFQPCRLASTLCPATQKCQLHHKHTKRQPMMSYKCSYLRPLYHSHRWITMMIVNSMFLLR